MAFVAARVSAVLAYGLVHTSDASFCSVIVLSMMALWKVHVTAGPSSAQRLAVACMHSSICSDMLALYPLVLAGVTQPASVPGVGAWVTLSRVFALHALLPGYLTLCCVRSCSSSEVLFEWYSLGGVPCACRLCLFLLFACR